MVSIKEMNKMAIINDEIVISKLEEHNLWKESLGKYGEKLSLDEIDLRNINIDKYFLDQAYIAACIFDGMNLCSKEIYSSIVCSSTFRYSNLESVDFSKSDVSYVDFTGANIKNGRFNRSDCIETVFVEADLTNANLIGSGFYDTDFRKVILCKADISSATFEAVLMNGAKLSGIKGILEANIKSINIGTRENPIIIEGNQAVQWLLSESLVD
jgi:uncharacterized protein YjbI with pentapeptide repeats